MTAPPNGRPFQSPSCRYCGIRAMLRMSISALPRFVNHAIAHYVAEGGLNLADRFEAEFRASLLALKTGPTRFPPYHRSPFFRRIRLQSFPYLIIYRENAKSIRVTLLKHERRHPLFGMTCR